MIPKKPAPDLIRGGYRFSEKIMLKQEAGAGWRFKEKSSRSSPATIRLNDWRSSMEASTSLQEGASVFFAGDGNPWVTW